MALTDSLISYWMLDEASGIRSDRYGPNDLTDNNTVTQATGKIGNAAQFTNANSESLSHTSNADFQTGDIDFTFAAWTYLDSKTGARAALGKLLSGTDLEYVLEYYNVDDRFNFRVAQPSDGTTWAASATANNLGIPALSTWYYIVCWHDSVGNSINIQVNDGLVNSTAYTLGVRSATGGFRVGAPGNYVGNYFDGRIDGVGYWKRVLSASERTTLYNSGSGDESWLPSAGRTASRGGRNFAQSWQGTRWNRWR